MKTAVFDAKAYDKEVLEAVNQGRHELVYIEARLTSHTLSAARGCEAVCSFVNDQLNASNLESLKELGVRLIALRSAGYNHVDLAAAQALDLPVVRVPEYSPHAVAEHAVALLLTLNRKTHRAYNRVRELNFSLEGLMGFDLYKKTVGVIGTGRIGAAFCRIMSGFGCRLLLSDPFPKPELAALPQAKYVSLDELLRESDVISLHLPLNEETRHIIDASAFEKMKPNAFLINTGRGALIDTQALVQALKAHRLGGAGLDVYEEEEGVFFHDYSEAGISDDRLARLLTFPNVLITGHQGFFTREAMHAIAATTLDNLSAFERGEPLVNEVKLPSGGN